MPVSLSSTLVDAGPVPLYLFGATSIVRGVPYCVAVPAEPQSLPHPVADGAPLSPNPTDSPICRSKTTYKLLLRQDRSLKVGIANKRLAAAWNKDYLYRLIGLKPKPI